MDGARQTEQTGAPDMDALRLENAQLRDRAEKAEAMYRRRDAEASAWQQTANDLYTGNPPSEPDMAAGLKLMQEHMRQRDQMKQERDAAMRCAEKAERERDEARERCARDDAGVTIHQCPPAGQGLMPCCGRTPFEVMADRMTTNPALVNCDRERLRARLADLERWREQAGAVVPTPEPCHPQVTP